MLANDTVVLLREEVLIFAGSGIAFDPLLASAKAFCGAVAALWAFWRSTVNLDQHRVVNVSAECAFNRFKVRLVTIARKLDAVR